MGTLQGRGGDDQFTISGTDVGNTRSVNTIQGGDGVDTMNVNDFGRVTTINGEGGVVTQAGGDDININGTNKLKTFHRLSVQKSNIHIGITQKLDIMDISAKAVNTLLFIRTLRFRNFGLCCLR